LQRRQFITLLGGGLATPALLPRAALAQSSPVIGYLHSSSRAPNERFLGAFKAGLKESGFTEGDNVTIEYRWAEGRVEQLPAMAADLVGRGVRLIATGGAEYPALAAKAATANTGIPVVFVMGGDPVQLGIVPSLARPAGNVTGINMFTSALESKRFGLLHEIVPTAKSIAALVNPNRAVYRLQVAELQDASDADFESAFARMAEREIKALQICADPNYLSKRQQLVGLAARHRIPTMYEWRDYSEAGGLMSYGTDLANSYREAGIYVGKVLKGAKPADLPVLQTTKFEFVINLQTAKAQGVEIAPTVLARADAVIE
jgi:ABC-type uncharacterized transport system substrate-binding protein